VSGIRDIVIGFYIANEGISILENAGRMNVPVCDKLAKYLEQVKGKED
ncbi:MAG TPA: holin, partial [Clostridiales bacterium]|nr:holin [Clostridiales bacterium]